MRLRKSPVPGRFVRPCHAPGGNKGSLSPMWVIISCKCVSNLWSCSMPSLGFRLVRGLSLSPAEWRCDSGRLGFIHLAGSRGIHVLHVCVRTYNPGHPGETLWDNVYAENYSQGRTRSAVRTDELIRWVTEAKIDPVRARTCRGTQYRTVCSERVFNPSEVSHLTSLNEWADVGGVLAYARLLRLCWNVTFLSRHSQDCPYPYLRFVSPECWSSVWWLQRIRGFRVGPRD